MDSLIKMPIQLITISGFWLTIKSSTAVVLRISKLKVESLNLVLLVVPTINYKRVWLFWRRPKSISVFVKSSSKLFNLEQTQTIQITK